MSEAVMIALITVFGGGLLTATVTWMARLNSLLGRLERRDRLSWLYIRSLIDHAYRHAPEVPLPEPPDGWLDDLD